MLRGGGRAGAAGEAGDAEAVSRQPVQRVPGSVRQQSGGRLAHQHHQAVQVGGLIGKQF